MADGVGFEPTRRLRACRFSRPVPSTTRPPIHRRKSRLTRRGRLVQIRNWSRNGHGAVGLPLDRAPLVRLLERPEITSAELLPVDAWKLLFEIVQTEIEEAVTPAVFARYRARLTRHGVRVIERRQFYNPGDDSSVVCHSGTSPKTHVRRSVRACSIIWSRNARSPSVNPLPFVPAATRIRNAASLKTSPAVHSASGLPLGKTCCNRFSTGITSALPLSRRPQQHRCLRNNVRTCPA